MIINGIYANIHVHNVECNMSKEMVNALKATNPGYFHLRAKKENVMNWNNIISGNTTYLDLERTHNLIINKQEITNKFINDLLSKHKNLISKDEKKNYRPFLKAVFTEMFKHAGAIVPNDSIIEELITNYNQSGYVRFFYASYSSVSSLESLHLDHNGKRAFRMDCYDPNCLKFNFGTEIAVSNIVVDGSSYKVCDLCSSVEFQLKCKDGNVTYENGKVFLTIPKELKNYKVNGKNLLDIIIEYLQKVCEKLGFKFETKIEHSFGEPLKVVSEPDISSTNDLKL